MNLYKIWGVNSGIKMIRQGSAAVESIDLFGADVRTKNVVHYIIAHAAPSELGAVKLNKVMWRADVVHYRRYGKSITGQSSYVRMPQGPVPNFVADCLGELKASGLVAERLVETMRGQRREFVSLKRPSVTSFQATEVEALHEAIDMVCMLSASEASERTHDALWEEFEDGRQMPIRAAAVASGELEPDEIAWAIALTGEAELIR